jgi:hypothetical protein
MDKSNDPIRVLDWVFVNGRYLAAQCTANQESLVKFGIVPRADGRHCAKRSFSGALGIEQRSHDNLIPWQRHIQLHSQQFKSAVKFQNTRADS